MNKKSQRRQDILHAFRRCVAQYGLESSSMHRVAAEAGVTQPLLMHHFGSRAGLVEALVLDVVTSYEEALIESFERVGEEGGAEALLRFLYGGAFAEISERDEGLFQDLQSCAARDEHTRMVLREVYARFQGQMVGYLRKLYPSSTPAACRRAGYGLMCITEGDDIFRSLGLPGRRSRDSLELGRSIVAGLGRS